MTSETSWKVLDVCDDASREALLEALAALCDAFPELTSPRREAAVGLAQSLRTKPIEIDDPSALSAATDLRRQIQRGASLACVLGDR